MTDGQEPEIKIKDGKHVEVAYPSGRIVRYLYNGLLSEIQLPLLLPPGNIGNISQSFTIPPREPED